MNPPDYSESLIEVRKLLSVAEELANRKNFVDALAATRKAREMADLMGASLLLQADAAGQLPKRVDG